MNEYTRAFERLTAWKVSRNVERDEHVKEMNARLESECREAYKVKFPKRKFSLENSHKNNPEGHSEIFTRLKVEADRYSLDWWAEDKQVEWALNMLAEKADVPVSSEWNCAYTVSDNDYRSQAFGASRYAKSAAEARMRDFIVHVPEAKVVEEFHEWSTKSISSYGESSRGWTEWRVMVPTTEIGIKILNRKKGEDLRSYVKNCWRSGVNPRVYLPF